MTTDTEKIEALTSQVAALKGTIARSEMQSALVLAGVSKAALGDASTLMASQAQVAFDEAGRIVTVQIGGEDYDSAADAAKAFLAERSHFKDQAPQGAPQQAPAAEPSKPRPEALVASAFGAPRTAPPKPGPTKLPTGNGADLLEQGFRPEDLVSEGLNDPAA